MSKIPTVEEFAMKHHIGGTPVILEVNAKKMLEDGLEFYLSENNVYLTNTIDKKYILTLT